MVCLTFFPTPHRQILNDCGIGLPPSKTTLSPTSDLDAPAPAHRVLIFCQLKSLLDLIISTLFLPHLPTLSYLRMDGSTPAPRRHAIAEAFNSDPSIDVLLLTTQVGGLGLNLTGADTVVFVEHDWNPMRDLQAMDRAHRLGQKRVVNVYRLITRGTLEEKIMGYVRIDSLLTSLYLSFSPLACFNLVRADPSLTPPPPFIAPQTDSSDSN